ncbi:MAG TPA: GntR family transcriptional regulator [Bacillota bacterium]|nr:GntR family transcriptional regulator [Bacillota bacterium]
MNHFKVLIANGELRPGDEIPSRRELARLFQINPNTVQRAYKEMEDAQLIHTERNYPSKVTTDEAVLIQVREELLHHAVETFVDAIHLIQVPMEEVLARVENRINELEREDDR